MESEKKCSDEHKEKERDGFFEFYKISEDEEQFFSFIYRRRKIYRRIIYILIFIIAMLTWLLCMK